VITIWGRTNSLNVTKVLWLCEELGTQFRRIDAGLEHGKVDEPDFRMMNPNGRVPVINDDGFVLWESNAIVRYLSYKYALGSLYPADVRHRATAEQWMDWQQTSVVPLLQYPFQGLVRRHPDYRDEAQIQHAAYLLNQVYTILDEHLADRRYLMGDDFTMADIPLGVTTWRWLNLPIRREELTNVESWMEMLKQHHSFRKHVAHPLT
jgi:glutathione S-transferase